MNSERQKERVHEICLALPGATEKLSHSEPTFFVKKRVFAMFSNNHQNDGHIAVLIPAHPGEQESLIANFPRIYNRPPYVGIKGWVGIELSEVGDDELGAHLTEAWKLIRNLR
ncbi:MAG TPA: MmcQ/YjbR family DNA-binding protein [Terriglobia bacterium]|nr:MmcQ/YjbR family DNA-binding protein [Terriglobia bacterium]